MIDLGFDLRSDTLTQPSAAMKQAMVQAALGDDVFGEDPTVRDLEERSAQLLGKEAALFVPSGSMGNLVALLSHAQPGRLLVAGHRSHIVQFELGSYARIAGLSLLPMDDHLGWLDPRELTTKWPGGAYYMPRVGVIGVENTHNLCGGKIYPHDALAELSKLARERSVPIHMDGARILHAAQACRMAPDTWTRHVDSVMMCFSKGLGAPVGSVIAGSREWVERARVHRKMLGGGMRQVGVLAAACRHALDHHVADIESSHRQCLQAFEQIAELPWLDVETPATNILLFETREPEAQSLVNHLQQAGVGALALGERTVRLVFHRDLAEDAVDRLSRSIQSYTSTT